VDVRLVAATNRNLGKMVARGQFRSDLYYRLNVFPILLPALRERREDIPTLVAHFVKIFSHRMKKRVDGIPPETMSAFQWHSWPGNIRELQNMVETRGYPFTRWYAPQSVPQQPADRPCVEDSDPALILETLEEAGWVVGGPRGAAAKLGLKRTTLLAKMKRVGISRPISQEGTERVDMARELIC